MLPQGGTALGGTPAQGGVAGTRNKGHPAGGADLLPFLELLAGDAPARSYDDLVHEAQARGASTSAVERLGRARSLALSVQVATARRRRREADLAALVDIACDLALSSDLETTLRLVTRRARMLVNMDMAHAYVLRAGGDPVMASAGGTTVLTNGARSPHEHHLLSGDDRPEGPVWTADYATDPRIERTPATDRVVRAEGLHAILAVPLRVDDAWAGLLCVAERQVHHFSPEEISLITSLADLTSAAASRARSWERAQNERAELERLARAAGAEAEEARRTADMQGELLDMVLSGADLETLLTRIGRESGSAVAVRDPSGTLLARTGRLSVRDSPDLERTCLRARTLDRPLPLPGGSWTVPLNGPDEHLGWLLFSPAEGDDLAREGFLAMVGGVVSALLLTRRGSGPPDPGDDHLLASLVHGEGATAHDARGTRRLSARLNRPHVLVAARTEEPPTDRCWAAPFAHHRQGLSVPGDDHAVLLLPGDDPGETARTVSAELGEILQTPVTAAAVGPLRRPEELAVRHREAVRCLDALVSLGGTGSGAGPRDLGFLGILAAEDYEVAAFVEDVLGPVLTYDAQRRTNLQRTLEVYFQCAESPTRAAEVLHVHPNTVARRLDRVTQLLDRNWQSPDQALELRLALHLQRTRQALRLPGH
ncbi:helix-turn-helix domain-containing protein [Nocardiopsis lucentensis]|uniref:helix-turn-helix domain-containing protein n=1 Tax=Nocardiopsis lucentensis TaxID=53441 RepID=UPI000344A897|nr:helix-turn-helix domain-containing protein [Nocardiopsis lucentensis]